MSIRFDKKKAAYFLFTAVLILILSNLILKKFFIKDTSEEFSTVKWEKQEIDSAFHKILRDFGIDEKLIRRKEIKTKNKLDIFFSYKIEVPADLPIPVILDDVFTQFSSSVLEIKSTEKEVNGKSILEINSNKVKWLTAEFNYSKDITRKKGMIGIMITQFEIDEQSDTLFFDIPESFCVLLSPSKSNVKSAGFINKKNKEYAVLIDDNINELEYKLAGNYSTQRIKNIVRTIVGGFSKAVFFVFDDKADFYGSEGYRIVLTELEKRKIKHTTLASIINLIDENPEIVKESFDKIVNELDPNHKKMVMLSREGFDQVFPSIAFFRKSGVKFVNPSLILK